MPDRGLMTVDRVDRQALDATGSTPAPWRCEGATLAQLTFEVDQAAALEAMPGDVTRPIPAYARLIVLDAPESPVGRLKVAALFVGGRYQLMPRNVLVEGIVDGNVDGFRGAFGGGFRAGKVEIERGGQSFAAHVSGAEGELGALTLPATHAVEPSMIRWDAWLGFGGAESGVDILEILPAVEASEAFLAKGAELATPRELPRTHTWRRFRNLKTVAACVVDGTVELGAPEAKQRWE